MHGLASWQTLNYFLDSSCITLSFVTSSLIERGKKDLHLNAGWKTHFRCLSWSKHDTSNEGKKILCQHLELYKRWMKFIFLSNRLVFAVDTYSCQYDPCSWSKSWKSYGNVDNEREKQDDKEKGGGERKWPYETAVSWLKGQQRSRQLKKKNTICPLDSWKYLTHKSLSVTFTT